MNTSLLHAAKGASALLVPFANIIKTSAGSWYAVFLVAAVMNFVVVALAAGVLRPLRCGQARAISQELAAAAAARPAV